MSSTFDGQQGSLSEKLEDHVKSLLVILLLLNVNKQISAAVQVSFFYVYIS